MELINNYSLNDVKIGQEVLKKPEDTIHLPSKSKSDGWLKRNDGLRILNPIYYGVNRITQGSTILVNWSIHDAMARKNIKLGDYKITSRMVKTCTCPGKLPPQGWAKPFVNEILKRENPEEIRDLILKLNFYKDSTINEQVKLLEVLKEKSLEQHKAPNGHSPENQYMKIYTFAVMLLEGHEGMQARFG
ncbi:Uncharacterized protein MCB1EB_0745 [Mycoavidus cysteinexigens]|uniref:Uncharacterized protein n=1 Tax=Mycoavidus cysteinexigens TaxID=1553431 RepID=A0A2Z6EU10_9BURK|nr:hypothetical protein [Mycoavidus cysteinexigens]BBE08906.1 Uncharacterized protein MCB1EB_0745 [Mycoavidus cysteinexigens]GLR01250.1 hypothetical protein GCM10007934_10620 [Mycoavidus cysteinexigens]